MAGSDGNKGDYGVGRGKPPKHSQWKKGQSGNPSGKRKKTVSLQAKLAKLAGEEIALNYNGSATSMSRDLAMLHAVLQKAMKGDQPSVRYVTDMLDRGENQPVAQPKLKITAGDINVLSTRADWVGLLEEVKAELEGQVDPDPDSEEDGDETSGF